MFQKVSTVKKGSKKLISLMLVFVILSSLHLNVLAADNSGYWIVKKDSSNSIYLQHTETGKKILEARSYDDSGNLVDFDLVEYARLLNDQIEIEQNDAIEQKTSSYTEKTNPETKSDSVNTRSIPITIYTYIESRNYTSLGTARKCTADVVGPASLSYGNQISTTETFSASVNLSGEKDAVQAGASFGWSTSSSSSSNFGVSFPVPSGKTGYVTFRPRYNTTEGTLRTRVYYNNSLLIDDSETVKGHSPKILATGFTDGIFALETY